MKYFNSLFLCICIFITGCQNINSSKSNSGDEVAAILNGQSIYLKDLDNELTQIIFNELNRIHEARLQLLSHKIDETLLKSAADLEGKSIDVYFDEYCQDKINAGAMDAFIRKLEEKGGVLDLRTDLKRVDLNTPIGRSNIDLSFRKQMRLNLIDSLRKGANVEVLLEAPARPAIDLSSLSPVKEIRVDKSKPTLTLITDPECGNCKEFFPIIDSIHNEFDDLVNFEIIPNSGYASIGSLSLFAAADQGDFWSYYKILNTQEFDSRDTSTFETLASKVGFDIDSFGKSIRSDSHIQKLRKNNESLHQLGLNRVPLVLVNGKLLEDLMNGVRIRQALKDCLK